MGLTQHNAAPNGAKEKYTETLTTLITKTFSLKQKQKNKNRKADVHDSFSRYEHTGN